MTDRLTGKVIAKRLPRDFSLAEVFDRFANRPGCLWLDSASAGATEGSSHPSSESLHRYSFLCSDPIDTLVAHLGDPDPWPTLASWCDRLPTLLAPDLPPFQGGIAGLVGYEAGSWLESTGAVPSSDLNTPAMSLGWYPWTIAVDHHRHAAWIIARGEDAMQVAQVILQNPESQASSLCVSATDRPAIDHPATNHPLTDRQHATHLPGITSNFESTSFQNSIAEIVQRIRGGDSFQVNLAQRLLSRATTSSPSLYTRLRKANPAPMAAYYNGGDFQVLSSSPEGFLQLRNRQVETRPIKGTVPRCTDRARDQKLAEELMASEKDRAENVMIVDLMRNDLSRVCTDDSVRVTQLCELETYQYVHHLVSVVQGELADGNDAVSLLKACFPGGSVTGAPKIEAMRTIAELEPSPRGPYCGTIGYISTPDDADFNLLIRTITATGGYLQIPVGGGITARSAPESEEAETWTKAEGMLRAIGSMPSSNGR